MIICGGPCGGGELVGLPLELGMCLLLRMGRDQVCWPAEKGVQGLGCGFSVPGSLRLGTYVVYMLKRLHFALLFSNGYGCKSCTGYRHGIRRCSGMIRLS